MTDGPSSIVPGLLAELTVSNSFLSLSEISMGKVLSQIAAGRGSAMRRQRMAIQDAAIFFIISWGIYMSRIREVIGDLVASFPRTASEPRNKERDRQIEQLAETIMEHGQMTQKLHRNQRVAVEVKELAFRLREKPKTITRALVLLRNQGRARRTDLDGLWELQVSPDNQSHGISRTS